MVLAHGARFDKASWGKQAEVLAKAGFRVLAIDFRGYGQSRGGDQVRARQRREVRRYSGGGTIPSGKRRQRVSVIGASMGGGASANAVIHARPGEIDRLILLAPVPVAEPERLTGPKLFVVSRGDGLAAKVREQFEKAPEPKELMILEGSAHAQFLFQTDQGERLMKKILEFLSREQNRGGKEMTAMEVIWPKKTRELQTLHLDSTIWNEFKFRDGDIIISTYGKSGTTWMQQIISQMLFAGDTEMDTQAMSPWVDYVIPPKEVKLAALEAQTHRRFVKTHLPVDALVYSPKAKYIYIGRDGRDVLWSFYNHHSSGTEAMYNGLNNRPGRVGPPLEPPPADIREYWHAWFEREGYPYWPFWENIRSWWEIRHLPNILMVHFDVLRKQLPEQMRRIARFLDIPIDEAKWDTIVEHCTFEWMREHGEKIVPLRGALWVGGTKTFINKGTNGRWRDTLTAEESAEYEAKALAELGPECARWLATGEG